MAAEDDIAAWATSGAMQITGRPDRPPLGPPAGLVGGLARTAGAIARWSGVELDPLAMLTARAAFAGLRRGGTTSCGGATRLLAAADGWVALSLARDEDVSLMPAWLACEAGEGVWEWIEPAVATHSTGWLEERASLLGLPLAVLPSGRPSSLAVAGAGATSVGEADPLTNPAGAIAVDLSGLWAGPLCGRILADAGLRVIKVESVTRPDGARWGPAGFFDFLNAGKESVALDFADSEQRAVLQRLLGMATVVIEASRPRALSQLGISTEAQVWTSITGYGRGADRVAFGDDAAVGGGLVCCDDRGPVFCADAVADPVTGMKAAAMTLAALARGGRWLLDVAMAGAAAELAGPTLATAGVGVEPAAPAAPTAIGPAPALGQHTDAVLADLGLA